MAGDTKVLIRGDANNAPATEIFLDMWSAEQAVAQQRMNPLEACGIPTLLTSHKKSTFPRERGVMTMQAKDIASDRRFSPVGIDVETVSGYWNAFDLDAWIQDGEDAESIYIRVRQIIESFMAAKARAKFSIVYKALNGIPASDSATGKADGLAFSVPVNWKSTYKDNNFRARNPAAASGKATGWNMAKLWRASALMQNQHMVAGRLPVMLTSNSALYGFLNDEDSVNNDYVSNFQANLMQVVASNEMLNPAWHGMCWAVVGETPTDTVNVADTDKLDCITSTDATVDGDSVKVQNNYVFSPGTVRVIMPSGSAGWDAESIEIYRDPDVKALKFRMSLYMGAVVLNPKFVGRIINKSELAA